MKRTHPRLSPIRLLRARLAGFAADFSNDTRGSVTVEAAIMLPVLVWAYCALYTFFDAYRQTSINHKAAYTISDMISRETTPIDDSFMDGSYAMLNFLTRSVNQRHMRVTVIRYDGDNNEYSVVWSQTRGAAPALAQDGATNWADKLPVMVDEERLILVETWTDYSAPFPMAGLNDRTIQTFAFTRPRFSPQVCWQQCGA